jgi:hypothetical protein
VFGSMDGVLRKGKSQSVESTVRRLDLIFLRSDSNEFLKSFRLIELR